MATTDTMQGKLLARNTTALTIGRLGSKVLVFLLVRFYTAVLTKEQFGTADLITSLCNFLIPLACAGLSSGFFRFAAEAKSEREQSSVFSAGVSILLLSSMGFALLSPILFLIPHFSEHVWLILLYVLCANVHYLTSDFIRAQGNYRLFAIQGILNTALNIAFNLLFLLPLSLGLNGYVLSIIAATENRPLCRKTRKKQGKIHLALCNYFCSKYVNLPQCHFLFLSKQYLLGDPL